MADVALYSPSVLTGIALSNVTISGTCVDASDIPKARVIRLYSETSNDSLVGTTVSSSLDGSFSFTANGGQADRFRALMVGEACNGGCENDQVFAHITGVPV